MALLPTFAHAIMLSDSLSKCMDKVKGTGSFPYSVTEIIVGCLRISVQGAKFLNDYIKSLLGSET
jgi:hypothetical protein